MTVLVAEGDSEPGPGVLVVETDLVIETELVLETPEVGSGEGV